MRIGIVGRGRAAQALGPRWAEAGHAIVGTRDATALPEVDVVVLAVPDGAIASVARELRVGQVWLHLSGAKPSSILRVADAIMNAHSPTAVGCLHPLVALADASTTLAGAVAGIEGEPAAISVAEQLARDVGLVPVRIDADKKALYHAAAVTVAGHATALFAQAMQLMHAAGMDATRAQAALRPLFASAAANLERGDPATVSTGPIVRGDAGTVQAHLAEIDRLDPKLSATYRLLGETSLALIGARLSEAQRAALSEALRSRG